MFDYQQGTKGKARQNRRNVRAALGTSGDQLPDVLQVLEAARALGALLDNASGGRFGISVFDFTGRLPLDVEVACRTEQDDPERFAREAFIPVGTAVEIVTEARRARAEAAAEYAFGGSKFSGVHGGVQYRNGQPVD